MNPPDEELHVISADGPINRRTALLQQRQREATQTQINPEAVERVLRAHLRSAVGAPLAQQLAAVNTVAQHAPSGLFIGSGVLIACGAVFGLLGVIQGSRFTMLAGVGIAVAGIAGAIWSRRTSVRTTDLAAPITPVFDIETLDAFDRVLDGAAADLGTEAVHHLVAIKDAMVRIATHARGIDEHFTHEDRLYLRECLRRYVPDTLQAFLRVPASQRTTVLLDGQITAEATMLNQLTALHEEIVQREKKIGRSAAEGLMKQDRFLASKRSH